MPTTYEPIATTTVTTPVATITFTSIPATYTDLRVVMCLADDDTEAGTGAPTFRFNGNTGTNYGQVTLRTDGTTISSQVVSTGNKIYALYWNNSPTSTTLFPMMTLDIMSYTKAVNKTVLITATDNRSGTGACERMVGMWRSTAAITQLEIGNDGTKKFETGSIATIYGIKAA
jgi:hypothetical protein